METTDLSNVTVLIPVLNEEKAIGFVLDEVMKTGVPAENIIVIDGGSIDRSVQIATSKGVLVVVQEGVGKAKAIKTGLKYVKTPYVLVIDGDGTYPAQAIPSFVKRAERDSCDLVIGARVYEPGSQKTTFRLGNFILTRLFNLLYGVRLSDVLSGMYLAKTEKLREVDFETHGFSIESEIVAHFVSLGKVVCEETITYRRRIDPRAKKLKVRHGLRIALDVTRLTWRYSPAFFILSLGTLLLIPGLSLGAWVAYRYLVMGTMHHVKGLAALILTGVGLQCSIGAILSLYFKRVELRLHKKIDRLIEYIQEKKTSCASPA